jgi:hypothetical protein
MNVADDGTRATTPTTVGLGLPFTRVTQRGGACRSESPSHGPELAENRRTRCAPIVDVVVAGRQVRGIGILFDYSSDNHRSMEEIPRPISIRCAEEPARRRGDMV